MKGSKQIKIGEERQEACSISVERIGQEGLCAGKENGKSFKDCLIMASEENKNQRSNSALRLYCFK